MAKKEFRTEEQFLSICEDITNDLYDNAAKRCVQYGFYAQDLIDKFNEHNSSSLGMVSMEDIVVLVEKS